MTTANDRPAFLVPSQTVGIADFHRHAQALDIEAVCARPPDFSIDPSLAGRIRSALGPALRDLAATPSGNLLRRQRLFMLPSAFEAFFGEPLIAPVPAGDLFHNATRPFLLQAWGERNRIRIVLRLFGKGAIWQNEAENGLRRALTKGVQLAPGVATKTRLSIDDLRRRVAKPAGVTTPIDHLTIDLASPVAFERRDMIAVDRDMVFGSILSRLAGVAAWHGMLLTGDWPKLAEEVGGASIDGSDLRPITWERRSFRQDGRTIAMKGLIGRLRMTGWFEAWLPLFMLAPLTHLGSHTTLGMGACLIGP